MLQPEHYNSTATAHCTYTMARWCYSKYAVLCLAAYRLQHHHQGVGPVWRQVKLPGQQLRRGECSALAASCCRLNLSGRGSDIGKFWLRQHQQQQLSPPMFWQQHYTCLLCVWL
jgi:hypothetical protein